MPAGFVFTSEYQLDPNFDFGPKPPVPAKHPIRGLRPIQLQSSPKFAAQKKSVSRDKPYYGLRTPQTPTRTSSSTTSREALPVNNLTIGSNLAVAIKKMSEASQDRVTADGHLQTQSNAENAATELGAMIDKLLDELSTKFNAVSTEIFAKMDDMSRRLDNLEASIMASQTNETDHTN